MPKLKPDMTPWLCSWPSSSKQAQGFPLRFWSKWCATYRRDPMLHLFCGGSTDGEVRVDIRAESAATWVGDFRNFIGTGFASVFADPPYTQEFADEWRVMCPTPAEIQKIALAALIHGGILGILHLQVIRPYYGFKVRAWHPVFCGTTKHLRCLTVLEKPSA